MKDDNSIVKIKDRKYFSVPVDLIKIINPRNRDKKKFKENVRSIQEVGQYKPITLNKKRLKSHGYYELICGQGRLEAAQALNNENINCEIVDVSDEKAILMSLIENLTRVPPNSIEFAKAIVEMKNNGVTVSEIAQITGHSTTKIHDYIKLMVNGEEKLIQGVEDGVFPISFAVDVSVSEDADVQNVLMEAYDEGVVSTVNLHRVRKIVENRKSMSRQNKSVIFSGTVAELKKDINEIITTKTNYVEQNKKKENRLTYILLSLEKLNQDPKFVQLLEKARIDQEVRLQGNYI